MKNKKYFLSLFILPLVILIVWDLTCRITNLNSFLLPSPEIVFNSFISLAISGELQKHIVSSTLRSFGGFFLACGIALPLAYLCYYSEKTERGLKLTLEALRFIPPLSLIPLLILWFGIGEASKIAIVVLASFFPIFINTLSGFRQISTKYSELADVLQLSLFERFIHIELPGSLPSILSGLRLGFGYSWRALVGAELIAASSGLGFLIGDASEMSQTEKVFVGILTIAFLGIIGDLLFQWISKRYGRSYLR